MASYKEDMNSEEIRERRIGRTTWINWSGSMALSVIGGLILSWWELKYHATNDQEWMVPLGLILFFTPLIVWCSLFLSDFCNSSDKNSDINPYAHDLDLER